MRDGANGPKETGEATGTARGLIEQGLGDVLSFAAGPITASTAKTMFERMAAACGAYVRDGKDPVLVAHIWQGTANDKGIVVEFCDKHAHGKGQVIVRQATLEVSHA